MSPTVEKVNSRGTLGRYIYRETDMPLINGGVGRFLSATPPLDSDGDGMPDYEPISFFSGIINTTLTPIPNQQMTVPYMKHFIK